MIFLLKQADNWYFNVKVEFFYRIKPYGNCKNLLKYIFCSLKRASKPFVGVS